jgi:putative FmdB family regulatory protein
MPIFEFLCPTCNRIYAFLSLSPQPTRQPTCPRCGAVDLTRVASAFAVGGRRERAAAKEQSQGANDDRMENEMMRMASEFGEDDAEDPRAMARMMRRMADASGEPVTPAMAEMLRRLEAGEDPETLEEELGPQLEGELGEDGSMRGGGSPTRDGGLYDY